MSSRREIYIDFQEAIRQAERLDEIADKLEQVSKKKMEHSMQSLAAAWKGENASAFLKKEDHLQDDIYQTSKNVRNIANDIRVVANRIYRAEMTAWQIANERKA